MSDPQTAAQINTPQCGSVEVPQMEGWAEECLIMIREQLELVGCCHGQHDKGSTPPMMYPEWIACAVSKREKEIAALQSKLTELESALAWASENVDRIDCSKGKGHVVVELWETPRHGVPRFTAPTLTDALMAAWKARGDK